MVGEDGKRYEWLCVQDLYQDLGTLYEVAYILRVPHTRVRRWTYRRKKTRCPDPVRCLNYVNLYRISDWIAWYDLRQTRLIGDKNVQRWM